MRTHHTVAMLTSVAALALTACNPGVSSEPKPDDKPINSTPATATPSSPSAAPPAPASQKPTTAPAKAVPNFVGQVLQTAQDGAQAEGFFLLTSHDSLGKSRMQVLDRNWKVCAQTPAAGATVSTDTKLDFGTVKIEESCP